MSEPSVRTRKVASLLQKEIADIVRNEVRDPRLQNFMMVTISAVDLAPDHRNATVYVSFMGQSEEEERKKGVAALTKAAGFIQRLLLKRLSMKNIPLLLFRYDDSFDYADKMSQALKKLS